MIIKSNEVKKIDLNKNQYILFYGINEGAKADEISSLVSKNKDKTISRYEEKEILENNQNIYDDILSKSLFDNEKIIIINRASDKIFKFVSELSEKNISDISFIINASTLEKKSKLRSFFEKTKELICVPFYQDTPSSLATLTQNFLKEKKINISQENINLITSRCNGDRGILKGELNKIEFFCKDKKNITTLDLVKLTNLIENYSISELVDNCLAKNKKKTMHILNENRFSSEDCITIIRTFLYKLKRILILSNDYLKNKNLDKTILSAKPPIFWKDKDIVKQQINKWSPKQIKNLIYYINEIELSIKKNFNNSINLTTNLIIDQVSSKTN
tara:strand:+ start:136 stop:1131 length:996 start_codon:yes stop_codon:yes gene_type:complete